MNAKILVIDDEPLMTGLISKVLEMDGHNVDFSNSPEEGLLKVEQTLPDLILLDIGMPRMDGYQVCQKLQEKGLLNRCAVIFLSGKTAEEDAGRSFSLGAATFIRKPFSNANLKEIVHLTIASLRGA